MHSRIKIVLFFSFAGGRPRFGAVRSISATDYSAQAEGRGPSLKMQFVCFVVVFRSTSGHTVAD